MLEAEERQTDELTPWREEMRAPTVTNQIESFIGPELVLRPSPVVDGRRLRFAGIRCSCTIPVVRKPSFDIDRSPRIAVSSFHRTLGWKGPSMLVLLHYGRPHKQSKQPLIIRSNTILHKPER
jgi:hypothetical protein